VPLLRFKISFLHILFNVSQRSCILRTIFESYPVYARELQLSLSATERLVLVFRKPDYSKKHVTIASRTKHVEFQNFKYFIESIADDILFLTFIINIVKKYTTFLSL
jgi:hypothetical protein